MHGPEAALPNPHSGSDHDLLIRLEDKVDALSDGLLGEHGHIHRIDKHIERLYDRDKELGGRIDQATKDFQVCVGRSKSLRDRFSGGWGVIVTILSLITTGAIVYGEVFKGK